MIKHKVDPSTNLTVRQRNLLFAVVKEYCEFGNTVSSQEIKEKYNFDVSPATVRNEFTLLRDLGYLFQPFTNSSSQPTEKAFKVFINQLLTGLHVSSKQQHELRQKIHILESKQETLQKEISNLLALETKSVSFAVDGENQSITGMKYLLSEPKTEETSQILDFLENLDKHKQLLLGGETTKQKKLTNSKNQSITTIFGGDNPVFPLGNGYAIVSAEAIVNDKKTVFGIITQPHILGRKKTLQVINAISEELNKKD
jgi:transcriptional regulator of heat shock response